jgi:DNA-binding transcriptional LysR family regulator
LFDRHARGMRLTSAGQSLLEDARAILARADQAFERAREQQCCGQSRIRLGLIPSAMQSLLPDLLDRARQQGFDMSPQVSEMITSRQLQALRGGAIDLGFARTNDDDQPAETVAALDDPYCLAIPAASALAQGRGAVALACVAAETFVGFCRHTDTDYQDRVLALCEAAGFQPRVVHEARNYSSVLALVSCGLGVAIVPASFSTLPHAGVVLRRIQTGRYLGRLVLLAGPHVAAQAWAERFIEIARGSLANLGQHLVAHGSVGLTQAARRDLRRD